jgi:hypothetical protein
MRIIILLIALIRLTWPVLKYFVLIFAPTLIVITLCDHFAIDQPLSGILELGTFVFFTIVAIGHIIYRIVIFFVGPANEKY